MPLTCTLCTTGQIGRTKNTHPQEVARYRGPSWGSFRLERAARDANFLPFLGQGKLSPRNGRLFMPIDLDAGTAGRSGGVASCLLRFERAVRAILG